MKIIKSLKENKQLVLSVLAIGIVIGFVLAISTNTNPSAHQHTDTAAAQPTNTTYTCSMHPQIKQNKPGLCPICAMDLVLMTTEVDEGEHVDPNEIQMTKAALALASVQTTIVKKGIPEKEIRLLGKVQADERRIAKITARFGGRIEKLYVNYTGQYVRMGQKLGAIYSPELITAQKELLEAGKYKETNPSFYKAARTKLKLWDLNDEQINSIENNGEPQTYFEVLSPISGTVTKRDVAIGDYTKEGDALFEVVDLSRVWVLFDAYESDLAWIKKGDKVDFAISSVSGKSYSGKVTYIDPFIDAQTRVAKVRVELSNPQGQLKPEMFANGVLTSNIAANAHELLIPKSAVLWTGKRAVVYIKVPDRKKASFRYREVELGQEAGNFYVVSKGLSEGEEIAINGVFKIDAAAQLAGKQSMMNPPPDESALTQTSFAVSGNCSMCKSTIEKAAQSVAGVTKALWDGETKMLAVSFDAEKAKPATIHKAIALSGYDTEKEKADDAVYNSLPACCKYERRW